MASYNLKTKVSLPVSSNEKHQHGECFLSLPPCRPLSDSIVGPRVKRLVSTICDAKSFKIDIEGNGFASSAVHELPPRPAHAPGWEYAIIMPFRVRAEIGLAFLLGSSWCFWSIKSEKPTDWRPSIGLSSPRMTMVALGTNPHPFVKFCAELIAASMIHTGQETGLPPNHWPPRLHTQWFSVMTETTCHTHPTSPRPHSVFFKLPADHISISSTVSRLRLGSVVSAAWRSSEELPDMLALLSRKTARPVEEICWEDLPGLCSKF